MKEEKKEKHSPRPKRTERTSSPPHARHPIAFGPHIQAGKTATRERLRKLEEKRQPKENRLMSRGKQRIVEGKGGKLPQQCNRYVVGATLRRATGWCCCATQHHRRAGVVCALLFFGSKLIFFVTKKRTLIEEYTLRTRKTAPKSPLSDQTCSIFSLLPWQPKPFLPTLMCHHPPHHPSRRRASPTTHRLTRILKTIFVLK